ncbi:OmpA family protein [Rufibacter quisquiliarum]|uniref:Outer membrane protein OmpA-like peptidoglycan-associated protein n=1 Tax=Rufibacter quisquiliarum TaxID=1549639 RepID=A0A839GDX8_9BACT|nr:OmpA family protein [Rufibacter quisquiliarum]MBA9077804.1 outer membrane protein OmpA-like peptidoglycan-associated protein [Rufibacter quisquiliarum]
MKKHALLLILSCALGQAVAQNVDFNKDNFKQDKDGFREAKKKLDAGDDIFAATSKKTDDAYRKKNYRNAIAPYVDAYKFNPNSALLNYRLGVAYLFSDEKDKALPYLEKALKLNPAVDPELGFYLGRAYQVKLEWQKAVTEYRKYLATLPSGNHKTRMEVVNKSIRECLSGEKLEKKPLRVFFDNAGEQINSKYADLQPVISADETVMVFTSRRPADQEAKAKVDKEPNDDVYISYKVNGKWSTAKQLPEGINTEKNEAAMALSADGQRLIFSRDENGGNLFETVLKGNEWSKPEELGSEINTKDRESSAAYSYDGKTLFFVSDRPNGIGKGDIYFSTLDSKGNWGKAINAGPKLNTVYEEGHVFMMPDGKTLYFTSEGHSSMGGFDIFKSVLENGQWSEPENVGYPLNTPDDDSFISLSANGRYGYIASSRNEGGKIDQDIVRVTFIGDEKPVILSAEDDLVAFAETRVAQPVAMPVIESKTPKTILVQGVVLDARTQKPLEAKVELIDNVKKEVIATVTSNSVTGKYLIALPAGKNYSVSVQKNDFLVHSQNFNLPANTAFTKIEKEVKLQPLDAGSVWALQNVFFAEGQAVLLPESMYELETLVEVLKDKKSLKAEMIGYTGEQADQLLAGSRAKAVADFLASRGINAKRLSSKATEATSTNALSQGLVELKLTGK